MSPVTLLTETCDTQALAFNCDVTCPGVGAIAMARGEWETNATGFIYLNGSAQVADDPSTWRFDFSTEGLEPDVPITLRVVCFTPPE